MNRIEEIDTILKSKTINEEYAYRLKKEKIDVLWRKAALVLAELDTSIHVASQRFINASN